MNNKSNNNNIVDFQIFVSGNQDWGRQALDYIGAEFKAWVKDPWLKKTGGRVSDPYIDRVYWMTPLPEGGIEGIDDVGSADVVCVEGRARRDDAIALGQKMSQLTGACGAKINMSPRRWFKRGEVETCRVLDLY